MKPVVVYTMKHCPFCEKAKGLLKLRNIPFTETLLRDDDDKSWDELFEKSGMRTMPQIFFGDKLVGGFSELSKLDQDLGGLTPSKVDTF